MANWELLPNSVLTGPLAPDLPYGGMSSPVVALIEAWVSAVLDGSGRAILPRNGGHADGAHNGVRAFDHTTNTWSFVTPDSMAYLPIGGTQTHPAADYTPLYPDGSPASVHSYDSYVYMPTVNKIWSGKGIYWSPGGTSSGYGTFLFDLSTNTWITSGTPDRPGGYSCHAAWDPTSKRALYHTSGGFYAYNPATNTNATLYTQAYAAYSTGASTLAIDPGRNLCYWITHHSAAPFTIKKIDLTAPNTLKSQDITVTGDTDFGAVYGKGLVFDNGMLVGFGRNAAGTGGTLYVLDTTVGSPVWTRLTTGGTVPPVPHINGTWKRFYKHPNGYYHVITKTGIYRILPDFGSIPQQITVQVAASYTIDYVSTPTVPPDPPGGTNPLPLNTWTLVPSVPPTAPPSVRVGKHMRVLYDSLRNRYVIGGGDSFGQQNGNPQVTVYDPRTGLTTVLSPTCVPAPGLMPNFPDNVVWVHDTKRDKYLCLRGFFNIKAAAEKPTTTLTPSATTGTITLTQGAANKWSFASWMVGLRVVQYTSTSNFTVIAHATITSVQSATVATATVGLNFASTAAIVSQAWAIEAVSGGQASAICGRNYVAGDTGIINDDCQFNPTTNKWELKDWPLSPIGAGSDAGGPSQGVYDEASDSVFMLKNGQGLMILHRATNTWEIIPYGAGMATGTEKTLVTSSGNVSFRAPIVQAGRALYWFSISVGKESFIEYNIDTKVWHAYPVTGLGTFDPVSSDVGDGAEGPTVYDPISNAVIFCNASNLTSDITQMYILKLPAKTLERRTFPVIPNVQGNQPIRSGNPFWDHHTGAIACFGRTVTGVQGVVCWHYRYGP